MLYPAAVHGREARDCHGLPKVLLGPVMPDPSMPCKGPPLKQPCGCFRSGSLQGGRPLAVFYSIEHLALHPCRYQMQTMVVMACNLADTCQGMQILANENCSIKRVLNTRDFNLSSISTQLKTGNQGLLKFEKLYKRNK
jgi:hypothetical protein